MLSAVHGKHWLTFDCHHLIADAERTRHLRARNGSRVTWALAAARWAAGLQMQVENYCAKRGLFRGSKLWLVEVRVNASSAWMSETALRQRLRFVGRKAGAP